MVIQLLLKLLRMFNVTECLCGVIGCTYSGSAAEVSRHKLTCTHSNVQLDTNSQQASNIYYICSLNNFW